MKMYVTGVSGTGKTSIAKALIAQGVTAVDIDDISHWENRHTGEAADWQPGSSDEWHDSHVWLCDIDKLKEKLLKSENAVAVGHASNQEDFLPFFDKIFVLRCSAETLINRIDKRSDNDFGKHLAERQRILNWQKVFESEMVAKGAIPIDTERPLEEVVKDICSNFD